MPHKIKTWLPWLVLIPAVLALFWPALLRPEAVLFPTFSPFSDTMVIHWPKVRLMAESWQAGQGLPYWSPLILSGMPLAANQLAMLFYPPAWLFLFFPPEPIFNLFFVLHLFLGGLGIYLLLRENFKLSALASLLGGLTFALNGKWLAHLAGGHVSMVAAIAWMPWAVLGVHLLIERGSRGAGEQGRFFLLRSPAPLLIFLTAVSLAMQILTHSLPVIYSVYLLLAIILWHASSVKCQVSSVRCHAPRTTHYVPRLLLSLALLLIILLVAAALGAVQLLPLQELAGLSNRSLSLSQAEALSLSLPQLLVGLLLPAAQAGHEYVIYTGLVALLLAPFGLTRTNRWSWFYGLVFVFALLFALGPENPLHALFYYVAPGFRWVRTPARIFFVGGLTLAILVGFGAERLRQTAWSPAAKGWLTRLTLALAPLFLLAGVGLAVIAGQTYSVWRGAIALALFIPAGLVVILLRVQRTLSAQIALALLGLLLFFDLAWFDASLLRFISLDEALAPGRPAAEYLAEQPGYFRVYSPSYSLPVQTAVAYQLQLADGVEPVHLAAYDQFMARAGGYHDAGFSVTIPVFNGPLESALREVKPDLKLLGLLNVAYLVSAFPMDWPGLTLEKEINQTYIYRNEQALPRAWVAHQAIPAESDWLSQLESQPNLDNVVIIENNANVERLTLNVQRSTSEITFYSANQIEIETKIDQPGWLVVSELWYPGWQAQVNGASQPVEKVNGLLRGVYLARPGQYHVSLVYRPWSVTVGGWISGITTLGLLVLGSVMLFKRWQTKW